jgi:hypothetical protein
VGARLQRMDPRLGLPWTESIPSFLSLAHVDQAQPTQCGFPPPPLLSLDHVRWRRACLVVLYGGSARLLKTSMGSRPGEEHKGEVKAVD